MVLRDAYAIAGMRKEILEVLSGKQRRQLNAIDS
jgi:hypothetical protein